MWHRVRTVARGSTHHCSGASGMMGIGARFRYLALNSGPLVGLEISTLQKIYKLKGALIKLEFGAMRVRGALEYVKRKGMGWV
jgi:hypothetical protein